MAPAEGGGGMMVFIVQIGLIVAIFYWLLIRPQKKEAERHKAMILGLTKGDEVVTVGGVIGSIVHITEERLTIKTGENTRMVIDRSKVARKIEDDLGMRDD